MSTSRAADDPRTVNNRGEIVGFYNDDDGFTTTGFLRTKTGRFVDISVPGARVTGPLKVNDLGQVVGIIKARVPYDDYVQANSRDVKDWSPRMSRVMADAVSSCQAANSSTA